MRLVFVNHAHPDFPHVSAMRLAFFATAMAQRGHQVVLLTAALSGDVSEESEPDRLAARLKSHDWNSPYHLSVSPTRRWGLEMIRSGRGIVPLRRCLTLWYMIYHGGVFEDWVEPCRPLAHTLSAAFRPHLVWGSFGNTSNLVLAQYIARHASCPWLMDIKDNWRAFIPRGLRRVVALRFRDAVGYTSNALHHEVIASKYFQQKQKQIVYSGVAPAFFISTLDNVTASNFDIMLIGGTYSQTILREFLTTLAAWLGTLSPVRGEQIRFVYAGSDGERVEKLLEHVNLPCATEVAHYLSLQAFAQRCRKAIANCYLWAPFTFHHKLLELLSCGRPVISYPGEADESFALAKHFTTPFFACLDAPALHQAFNYAWKQRTAPRRPQDVDQWTWPSLAQGLERFFLNINKRAT